MSHVEKRELRAYPMDIRASGERKIGGYAAVFGASSVGLPFEEIIAKGAFRPSLEDRSDDIVMAWAHDLSKPLASRNAGSLILREDNTGLAFEAALNGTSWSRDAFEAIQSGAVRQVSFMFKVLPGGEQWRKDGNKRVRTITSARLLEISPVVFAAYPSTAVGVRTAAEVLAGQQATGDGMVERDALRILLDLQ